MVLLVSSGELKIRPDRIERRTDIIFATLRAACLLVACASLLVAAPAANAASAAPVAAEKGMVVSAQHLATKIGVDILKRGGTAIDASVAVPMPWPWSIRPPATSAAAAS
jgi:gamma-glutamyltranspeptidase/glutathione hydrolase